MSFIFILPSGGLIHTKISPSLVFSRMSSSSCLHLSSSVIWLSSWKIQVIKLLLQTLNFSIHFTQFLNLHQVGWNNYLKYPFGFNHSNHLLVLELCRCVVGKGNFRVCQQPLDKTLNALNFGFNFLK